MPSTRPVPQPGAGEVLIEVEAAGVNRPDVLQRQGLYPPPPGASDLLGLEVAGTVVALGPGATRFKLGDAGLRARRWRRLCRILRGAGSARRLPVPRGLVDGRGRGAARDLLHRLEQRVRARRPEARANGCSSMAARAASAPPRSSWRMLFGARVFATAGSADKVRGLRGARRRRAPSTTRARISSRRCARRPAAAASTSSSTWSAATISSAISTRRGSDGRHRADRLPQGSKVEIDLMRLMMRRLTLTGSTLRPRTRRGQGRAWPQRIEEQVWPLIEAGKVQAGDRLDLSAGRRRGRPSSASTSPTISARSCW